MISIIYCTSFSELHYILLYFSFAIEIMQISEWNIFAIDPAALLLIQKTLFYTIVWNASFSEELWSHHQSASKLWFFHNESYLRVYNLDCINNSHSWLELSIIHCSTACITLVSLKSCIESFTYYSKGPSRPCRPVVCVPSCSWTKHQLLITAFYRREDFLWVWSYRTSDYVPLIDWFLSSYWRVCLGIGSVN